MIGAAEARALGCLRGTEEGALAHIIERPEWAIAESKATPEAAFYGRREILKTLGIAGIGLASAAAFRSPNALAADCLSTGLYVLGPDRALQLALGWPGIELLVLEMTSHGLTARFTPGFATRIQTLDDRLRLEPAAAFSTSAPRGGR